MIESIPFPNSGKYKSKSSKTKHESFEEEYEYESAENGKENSNIDITMPYYGK